MSGDKRSKTSRQNLEGHIPEALSPEGNVVITVRLPTPLAEALRAEAAERGVSLSELVRERLTAS